VDDVEMSSSRPLVGILAPMTSELRPVIRAGRLQRSVHGDAHLGTVAGARLVASLAGIGFASAAAAAERLLDDHAPDRVVVVGIAGGVAPGLAIGDLVVPDLIVDGVARIEYRPSPLGDLVRAGTIVSYDGLTTEPDEIARLVDDGVLALDMESSAVAAVCERRGVAWSVVRSISDRLGTDPVDDAVFGLVRPDGSPDLGAVLRFVATHPSRLPGLIRLGRYSGRAAHAAAVAAVRGCAAL